MALLVNLKGRTVEVDKQKRIEYLIERGFKFADKVQEGVYYRERKNPPERCDGEGVFFRKNNNSPHGYGQSTAPLIYSLEQAGVPVVHDYTGQKVGVVYSYPHPLKSLQTDKKVLYSMFESTMIDPDWVEYLDIADKIFVPSHFCQKAFASRGVNTEVIPLGYNQDLFYYKEKEDDDIFTFTMYNAFDQRKGWDILFGAFVEEFGQQEDVKLILKSVVGRLPFPILRSKYPNVEVILERYNQERLRELLWQTDCFVFPSRGEGFGLPPLEALACGTTSIIPNASGMSEYFDDKYFIELEIEGTRPPIYENFDIKVVGEMVEPSKKDLRKKLRWAYEHRGKCWEMGFEGAEWVRRNYPIQKTGVILADRLKEIGIKNKAVDVVIPNPKQNKKSVAFFMKNRDMYSGGRIFSYQILQALCELGYDTTIYTNMHPPWEDELDWNRCYKTVLLDDERSIKNVEVDADIYMGSVFEGNVACVKNHIRTGNPAYSFIFDPIPMIEEFDPDKSRIESEKNGYYELDNLVKDTDVNLVFLTEYAKEKSIDYYGNNPAYVLQPCVNDKVADKYKNDRENIVIASATTGERDKGFEKALQIFSLTPDDWEFHIFTSSMSSQLDNWIRRYGLKDRVVAHYDRPDEEKFEMYSKAKVMFCPSPYEGYGMWLAEGRYMGLECVIIDSGALREVAGNDKHIHIAKRGDDFDLANKLKKAMNSKKFIARKKQFKFETLVNNLKTIIE